VRVLSLERVALDDVPWADADRLPDRVLFQTRAWLDFIAETQHAEPVVAAVHDGQRHAGWFTGAVVRRAGVRILGSPFAGWTTMYMGFNLDEGVSRREACEALGRFAFGELRCLFAEVCDRRFTADDVAGADERGTLETFLIDLTKPEEQLFSEMSSSTRRNVRQGLEKHGVILEEADDRGFVDDYYAQLEDVFAKRSLLPTYAKDRVRALFDHLHPTGNLLLLRARSAEGECVATVIFPGFNRVAYYWGGASWRQHQKLRPNEPLIWEAMRTWRERGISELDLAGAGAAYKRNYGAVEELSVPVARLARYGALTKARTAAKRAVRLSLKARGRVRRLRGSA
jgi:hypothetical protein